MTPAPALHIDPDSFEHKFAMTCGHRYHYVEEGDPKGEPLLLVHGFPDIWYGWRHQIKYLANLGYRVIVPDCLGYGQTDSPMELEKYGLKSLCTQLAGLLDSLNISKVTLIGHDWGGATVWRFGLYYPNRVHGIISICTPYNPPATRYRSLEEIVKLVPEFEYQLEFADPATAAKLDRKPHKMLLNVLSQGNMHEKDYEYIIDQYKLSGFRGPLNYYKTTRVNFEDEVGLRKNIDLPCWLIQAMGDPYLRPHLAKKMKEHMPQLKVTEIDAGHFVMTEKPDEVNAALKTCLEDLALRRSKASL
ncbi:Alpha/Beta hydrolase protein [Gamsiella multidivaricata]|uniref:Alpha/Beta hydrolase protein n=1 Tax=Gamsiella multidivaricata TaxID=101098 RepID=UPI00221EB724|nr:Alpha/Beta hydrolase protein [Gamsiella multidivaricata]KAG0370976.1 hypothetical protein BGZ54_002123 [Gamsiella multidivaricata]KAI7823595.1 Alpha/Beta hydrolase protein [Gamsiella multidivaricata]